MRRKLDRVLMITVSVVWMVIYLTIYLAAEPLIIDHTSVHQFDQIPDYWLEEAKKLRVHHCTQSHGSQPLAGLLNIEQYIDPKYGVAIATIWHWAEPTLPPAEDPPALRVTMHGAQPSYYWSTVEGIEQTERFASSGLYDCSIFMWCGEHSGPEEYIQQYLDTMDMFEQEFPNVRFIYATGSLAYPSGVGRENAFRGNRQIRNYAIANNKILYDVEDIEMHNLDGDYYPDATEDCEWCYDWCNAHPEDCQNLQLDSDLNPDCPGTDLKNCCFHTHGLLCRTKGKAYWVMMARLAGWDGITDNQPPVGNAGPDQTVIDNDRNGSEQILLDGSASSDPDGSIVSFIWREGGAQIASGAKPKVTLSVGMHNITLIVTDNGGLTDTDTVAIKVLEQDREFRELPGGCYNNVINPLKGEEAIIVVEIKEQGHIKIDLYDTRGNKIKELADEEKQADIYEYHWDGKDDSNNIVASGLYFVHIEAGGYRKTKKIILVK